MPVGSWLIILGFCIAVGFSLLTVWDFGNPFVDEILVAEVGKLWVEQREDQTGGSRTYHVNLRVAARELACTVPALYVGLWHQLEQGKIYEFEVSRSRRQCYLKQAMVIEAE